MSEPAAPPDVAPEEPADVPAPHVVLWTAMVGTVLGLVVLFGDVPWWNGTQRALADEGPFLLWAAAIAVQPMSWLLAFPVIRTIARRWRTLTLMRSFEVWAGTAALVVFAAAIAFLPPLIGDVAETIPNRRLKLMVLNVTAFALAIYAAQAMWCAAAALRASTVRGAADVGALRRHQRARADLELLLGILALLVSLAVIASAALRALTVHVDPNEAIPAQAVILYGIILSLLLALTYVPAYLGVLHSGRILRDRVAPMLPLDHADFDARTARRERLDKLLGLDVAASVSFRASVAILAPLLGSLTSLIPNLGAA